MKEMILAVLLLFYLFAASVLDLWFREISLALIAAGTVIGLAVQLVFGAPDLPGLLYGCIPGCGMLLFSLISRQAIGFGDSAMVFSAGFYLGLMNTLLFLGLSFLTAGLWSILFLIMKKRKGKDELPFIPFLLAGYVLTLAVL